MSYAITFRTMGAAIAMKDDLRTRLNVEPALVTLPLPASIPGTVENTTADLAGAFHRAKADAAPRPGQRTSAASPMETYRAVVNLYALHHNYCQVQADSEATPAMAAGLDKKVRDTSWIVELIDARAPRPRRPSTYRKAVRP